MQKHLRNRRAGEDVIDQEIVRFKELRRGEEVDKETQEVMQNISGRTPKDELSTRLESGDEEPGYQSDDSTSTSSRGRGRGRGRGRASRGGRGQSNESTSRGRGSRGGRGARAGRGKAPVVEETSRGSLSIKEAFASASQKTSGRNGGAKRNSTFRYLTLWLIYSCHLVNSNYYFSEAVSYDIVCCLWSRKFGSQQVYKRLSVSWVA